MGAETRIIRLNRETLEWDGASVQTGDNDSYFSTDYFDSLIVQKKDFSDSFTSIMNLKENDDADGGITSAQSYTLYFSEDMRKKYEENSDDTRRNCPFDQNDKRLNFLSVIQVHITPEIFRRMQYGERELWESNKIILEPFLDDIYDIIGNYENREEPFVYRVYQVLSAGDFAVVMKSCYPETSFKISSLLRKRIAGKWENGTVVPTDWALYKTYTLLTIEKSACLFIKDKGDKRNKRKEGSFVIRGCYSCHYWAHQQEIRKEEELGRVKRPQGISGLNGRYDFSLELTEKEFFRVYPIILRSKGGNIENIEYSNDAVPGEESEKVLYLVYLLQKRYLSYINERYLLGEIPERDENEKLINENVSKCVLLDNERLNRKSLRDSNNKYIAKLLSKYDSAQSHLLDFAGVHKNLEQYLSLLKKQILSCQEINQFSDTRIYAREIGVQLETVLDSFEIYWEIYVRSGRSESIKENLVEYIREAVHAIDSYAEYVRNNNLQSIQTPNYNLESNMSMEKIMIAYSQYLKHFMESYQGAFDLMIGCKKKKYFPIVIPDLHGTDICVEALFPEGQGPDWEMETQIYQQRDKDRSYLLVIDSPTLTELGDVPVFMSMLFHELAHQFRYEDRATRNLNLLKCLTKECVSQIAANIALDITQKINGQEMALDLQKMLQKGLEDAVEDKIIREIEEQELLDTPLNYFLYKAMELLADFCSTWNYQADMEAYAKRFLKSIEKECNLYNEPQLGYVEKLGECIERERETSCVEGRAAGAKVFEKIMKYEFVISWLTAYDFLEEDEKTEIKSGEWLLDEKRVAQWIEDEELEVEYEELWSAFDGAVHEEKISHIRNVFKTFGEQLQECIRDLRETNFKCIEEIFKEAYPILCEEWRIKNTEFQKTLLENREGNTEIEASISYRPWALIGRQLGIDYKMEKNQKKFCSELRKNSYFSINFSELEGIVDNYREITADMFMYAFLEMTPFAYVNLVTLIIPEADLLLGNNLERIVDVLYVMEYDITGDANVADLNYRKLCCDILSQLDTYCKRHGAGRITYKLEKIFEQCRKELSKEEPDGKSIEVMMGELLDTLKEAVKKTADGSNERTILLHIEKLCKLIRNIMSFGRKFWIDVLEEREMLKRDYLEGAKMLRVLREKIKEQKDPSIDMLLELGMKNVTYLEQCHYKTGVVEDAELNDNSIKFLLRQYYSQKITNARADESGEVNV